MSGQVSQWARIARRMGAAAAVTALACAVTEVPVAAATGWSVTPSPNATYPQGGLAAISCPATTDCTAVGSYPNTTDGGPLPLAETWNGTTWSIKSAPLPVGAVGGSLDGMACWATSGCIAVGGAFGSASAATPLVEHWNGTSWTAESLDVPPGSTAAWLAGIACPAVDDCVGVGSYQTSSSVFALAEGWNGTTWTEQSVVVPGASGTALDGVACPSIKSCTAVGFQGAGSQELVLAVRWDGTGWTVQDGTDTHSPNSSLNAVACSSDTACTAVGVMSLVGSHALTLVEGWDGTAWSIEGSPNPTPVSFLFGVTCPTSTFCTAVGSSATASSVATLVETWDGTVWRSKSTPNPAGSVQSQLDAVSCPTASSCTAVGASTYQAFFNSKALAEHWAGTGWKIQKTPNPKALSPSSLAAVSCASASACAAVGYSVGGEQVPLVERWNGTKWTVQHAPNPAGSTKAILAGVSCPTTSDCVAAGYFDVGTVATSLVEQWNGTNWAIVPTPSPAGAGFTRLSSVSCTSSAACTAVGTFGLSSGHVAPYAERWDGTTWTLETVPVVGTSTDSYLNGVACVSPTACTAVGWFNDAALGVRLLAEAWDGTAWTIETIPGPAGSSPALAGVSCWQAQQFPFAISCMAVGLYYDSSGLEPLAELWNGTGWSVEPAPGPGGLAAVSCKTQALPSSIACLAVGQAAPDALDEIWNGSTWAIQATPSRGADTETNELFGVACTSTKACVAVGDALLIDHRLRRTLVEGYAG